MSNEQTNKPASDAMLIVKNDGPRLVWSNYWDSEQCDAGILALSPNDGAFRLLVPPLWEERLRTELGNTAYVVVSRPMIVPPFGLRAYALEILFEDHSNEPFSIHLSAVQVFPFFPASSDHKRRFRFAAYSGPGSTPNLMFEYDAYFRVVPKLPCLKPINPKNYR